MEYGSTPKQPAKEESQGMGITPVTTGEPSQIAMRLLEGKVP